jgi:formyltetrahydrofolate-dependent phosphoribosylglycinamide formyltransferase
MRIGILLSGRGRGSNMQAIIDACASGAVPGEVALVISTTAEAPALARARASGVEAQFADPKSHPDAESLDRELADRFQARGVDTVALGGYLRLLTPGFLRRFDGRVLNVHPSLLPAFGGRGFYRHHVHEAVLESGAKFSGATVHFVDEEYDHGPIILQEVVPVYDDDTPDTLAERVLKQEHILFPRALRLLAEGRLEIRGRRVVIR